MPKFQIETHLTVVLLRKWEIEAVDADAAADAFEEGKDNAEFISEESINIIGDETVESVTEVTNATA